MPTLEKDEWTQLLASANSGDAQAQSDLGCYYENGANDASGIVLAAIDPHAARAWYQRAAEQGNRSAQEALSVLLSSDAVGTPDYPAAIDWAKKAIAQGSATAAYNLALIYRDQRKPKTAFRTFQRAATMGDTEALLQIGLSKLFGFGTPRDVAAAFVYLTKIAQLEPSNISQRSRENALYWQAVISLMGLAPDKHSVARARQMLESANADDDHEQANEILNLIGKTEYLVAKNH